jgi:Family of unknown function (DUF6941)
VHVSLWLADFGQSDISQNKVTLIGAGWNITTTPLPMFAIAAGIDLPWEFADEEHSFLVQLFTSDGKPVPGGADPGGHVKLEGKFKVGATGDRPVPPGSELRVNVVANVPAGLVLEPGMSYEWRCKVDEGDWAARVTFYVVRPDEVAPAASPAET